MIAEILSICLATTIFAPTATEVTNSQHIVIEEVATQEKIIIPEELRLKAKELGELLPPPPEEPVKEEPKTKEIDYKVALKELGYYRNEHSSQDINMRDAVLRFQSDHNLTVDGSFGPQSLKALTKRLEDENFVHRDIVNQPPTQGKWITINKTKRILTLYQGKEVVKKYPVAQGKSPSSTPEGKFTIVTKLTNPAWGGAGIAAPVAGGAPNNPLGSRWLGISHGGGGKYGVHGNAAPNSIGTDVSLGCVRMINSDVKELYDLVGLRTPIWISTHEGLKKYGVDNKSYTE